ncbi:DsrE family protein [uncultured Maribacter sp.]|uniref:DsrE family protein n=1 Tax=uncultured Maribacter sp. TaxID=431308 RepID=UPI002638FE36|nr:DsrE family protein [uncultured Maribacter sp.]
MLLFNRANSYYLLLITLFLGIVAHAQIAIDGPIITGFGKVYKVNNQDFEINKLQNFHVVFDVSKSPEKKDNVNKWIETAARFLNMHAQNGISINKMKVAVVIHGSAFKDVMNSEAYKKKYGIANPNEKLNKALLNAGVQIILCGQSATYRGLVKKDLIPEVQLSLSAMTAIVQLQNQNYRLINF